MIYQMGEHCWRPVMGCPLQYNHDPNGVSLQCFDMAAPTKLKGGNAYILWGFQLKSKAFTAMQYGSPIQEIFLSVCLLRRVAYRSTYGLNRNLPHKFINNLWESIHFVLSLKILDILPANYFLFLFSIYLMLAIKIYN